MILPENPTAEEYRTAAHYWQERSDKLERELIDVKKQTVMDTECIERLRKLGMQMEIERDAVLAELANAKAHIEKLFQTLNDGREELNKLIDDNERLREALEKGPNTEHLTPVGEQGPCLCSQCEFVRTKRAALNP